MRRQFMSNLYYRDLYLKLQGLNQGSKLVDKYHKEIEITIIQVNVVESRHYQCCWATTLFGAKRHGSYGYKSWETT